MNKKNFIKNQFVFNIFFLILLSICILFIFFNINKGLDFTDESYSLLRSLYPELEIGKITYFGYLNKFLLDFFNQNLSLLKIFTICLLSVSFINLSFTFNKLIKIFFNYQYNYIFLLVISFAGIVNFYSNWRLFPNYDFYNLIGVINFLSGLILFFLKKKFKYNLNIIYALSLISIGLLISLISKPSTFIILSILALLTPFFIKDERISVFINCLATILISFLFFLIFLKMINISYQEYITDLIFGSDIKKLQDPRYDIKFLLLGSIKQLLFFFYTKSYVFIAVLAILYIEKKFIQSKGYLSIIFSSLLLLVFKSPLFAITCLGLHIIIAEYNFLKKNFFKVIYLPFVFFICYFGFSIGTNTNFVVHLKKLDILAFLLFFYLLNLFKFNYRFKEVILNTVLIGTICILVTLQFNQGIKKPYRLHDSVLKQTKKINIKPFNSNIFIDKSSHSFLTNIQDIFFNNNWKSKDSLIELSGRYPVFNVILEARYVSKPWYLGGYDGSTNFVKSFLKETDTNLIKNSWIITSDYKFGISEQVLEELNLNLNKDYIYVDKFYDKINDRLFKVYKPNN
tara:strand:- start:7744 stop:9453 length:1710 start_codon:yes stop_codon:yes gene_type:complete